MFHWIVWGNPFVPEMTTDLHGSLLWEITWIPLFTTWPPELVQNAGYIYGTVHLSLQSCTTSQLQNMLAYVKGVPENQQVVGVSLCWWADASLEHHSLCVTHLSEQVCGAGERLAGAHLQVRVLSQPGIGSLQQVTETQTSHTPLSQTENRECYMSLHSAMVSS